MKMSTGAAGARVVENALRGVTPAALSWSREPLSLHTRLPGYTPTPLVDVPSLATQYGVGRVLVKDESSRLGLPSFKMLGASWATYRALVDRLGREPEWHTVEELAREVAALQPLSLAAATDGNHGRAVARMAHLLGLGAHIFVPEGTAGARIEAIASEGAAVSVVAGDYDDAVTRSAAEASATCVVVSDTSWPGYTETPTRVIEGYSTVFFEIDDALAREGNAAPDLVVVPIGVGALAAAAVSHFRRADASSTVLASVEPVDAACVLESVRAGALVHVPGPHRSMMAGLNCGTPSLIAWPIVSRGLDWCVAIDDEDAAQAMRALAEVGIVAGETGAASLGGLAALANGVSEPDARAARGLRADATVLLLCTEGATDPGNYERLVGRTAGAVAREVDR